MISVFFLKYGIHAYSNLGLTSALYNFIIICCDLHLIVLLIRPSVVFAFLIPILHCSENVMLLSTVIPKSLFWLILSVHYHISCIGVYDFPYLIELLIKRTGPRTESFSTP